VCCKDAHVFSGGKTQVGETENVVQQVAGKAHKLLRKDNFEDHRFASSRSGALIVFLDLPNL
jgi:hypothetical protein